MTMSRDHPMAQGVVYGLLAPFRALAKRWGPPWARKLAWASEFKRGMWLSAGTLGTPHVCSTIERIDMPCDPAGPILYTEDCTATPVAYEDSSIIVPDGPGLGIEVDEEHLREIRYRGTRLQRLRRDV